MQKKAKRERELVIAWKNDRMKLHSAISLAMKRKQITMGLRGGDILRGTVFGMIDHSEYSFKEAVEKSLEMSKLPGTPADYQAAIIDMMACIERGLPNESHTENFSDEELVKKVVEGLLDDVKKTYCYDLTCLYLKNHEYDMMILSTEIIKDMVLKKLIADDSTENCMYEYAYKKAFMRETDGKSPQEIKGELVEATASLCNGVTLYQLVLNIVDEIYASNEQEE